MKRGTLRVYLGAAPGVGKTFAMLEEGLRLQDEGRVVVVAGALATHRRDIAALAGDLECTESDSPGLPIARILERAPDVVLVDELARRDPAGSETPTRWEAVGSLLDAGIDVLSTLNIQSLESLNDVVHEITGVREPATIPDDVIRQGAEIEVVDLPEERLRDRLKAGKIYPPEDVDTRLANYFRLGNLSALRELTLSWAADRVDETVSDYRLVHGINEPWETRERIVVGLNGAPGADAFVRRAGRSAMRSRADLLGLHVRADGRTVAGAGDGLAVQRELLKKLGGAYHELKGDDVVDTLLAFARSENATRILLGTSRRGRLREKVFGSPVTRAIRDSGPIEIDVVPYEPSVSRPSHSWRAGRSNALPWRRRAWAWVMASVLLPALTMSLLSLEAAIALENMLLLYLLVAVAVGIVGGALPALGSAGAGFLLANWFFTPPFRTWKISDAGHLFALFAFLVVASVVGLLVGNATRRSAEARRARAQTEALALTTDSGIDEPASGFTTRIRDVFAMSAAAVLRRTDDGWDPVANVGVVELRRPEDADEIIPLTHDSILALSGGELTGDDRTVLRALAAQMAQALEREHLEKEAASTEALVETDRLRTALLNAVSHDLRTPLATIKASVTSLLETGVSWTEAETKTFLEVVLDQTEHLNRVVGRLLDASRIQAGAVNVFLTPVGLDEVVAAALAGLKVPRHRITIDIPDSLPPVIADPPLLERVIANLVENALAWSPETAPVRVEAGEVAGRVDLRIIDRGPGIDPDERDLIYRPFQRLDDSSDRGGVGLGMSVARGFLDAMGNALTIEDTPGGGTTMVVGFEQAPPINSRATVTITADG